mmetsp:Transcript_43014/g.41380  ORF Transcript_43014/g.41380 Transcript_43014/m.41380 type:complete len:165 (+) Transcript_43014:548-1042(+)
MEKQISGNPSPFEYQGPQREVPGLQKNVKRSTKVNHWSQMGKELYKQPEAKSVLGKFLKKPSPGPGSYDVDFKNELKILDQKLTLRYQFGPFGSTSPRFKETSFEQEKLQREDEELALLNHPVVKKQELRKHLDQALDVVKKIEINKQSPQFKSNSPRFLSGSS